METEKRKAGRPKKEIHRVKVTFTVDPEHLEMFKETCRVNKHVESRVIDDFMRQVGLSLAFKNNQ